MADNRQRVKCLVCGLAIMVVAEAAHLPHLHRECLPVVTRAQYVPGGLDHGQHGEPFDFPHVLQQGAGVNMSAAGVSSVLTFDPLKLIRFPKD
jgi:hypothetical protein